MFFVVCFSLKKKYQTPNEPFIFSFINNKVLKIYVWYKIVVRYFDKMFFRTFNLNWENKSGVYIYSSESYIPPIGIFFFQCQSLKTADHANFLGEKYYIFPTERSCLFNCVTQK